MEETEERRGKKEREIKEKKQRNNNKCLEMYKHNNG
jgi:hypothetical protein